MRTGLHAVRTSYSFKPLLLFWVTIWLNIRLLNQFSTRVDLRLNN